MEKIKNDTDRLSYLAHELRLCNFSKKCGAAIHQAQVEKPTYMDFLCNLFAQELADRDENKRKRLHSLAQLPKDCNLDGFDFNHPSGITKPQMKELRQLVWLDQIYNIMLMGPCGTGKTYIASGLVNDAINKGYRAMFTTMENLISTIRLRELSAAAMARYNRITKLHLLAIDDIMLFPIKKDEAAGFFNLINTLHQQTAIIITTNKSPSEWAETMQDPALASAILDRLLFRCDVIKLEGNSYRMEHRKSFRSSK